MFNRLACLKGEGTLTRQAANKEGREPNMLQDQPTPEDMERYLTIFAAAVLKAAGHKRVTVAVHPTKGCLLALDGKPLTMDKIEAARAEIMESMVRKTIPTN